MSDDGQRGFDLGGLAGLLGGFQQKVASLQAEAEQRETVGEAGGGLVTVTLRGTTACTAVHVDPSALGDRELLEDLLRAAISDGLSKAASANGERLQSLVAGLPLPPGLLPGM